MTIVELRAAICLLVLAVVSWPGVVWADYLQFNNVEAADTVVIASPAASAI